MFIYIYWLNILALSRTHYKIDKSLLIRDIPLFLIKRVYILGTNKKNRNVSKLFEFYGTIIVLLILLDCFKLIHYTL